MQVVWFDKAGKRHLLIDKRHNTHEFERDEAERRCQKLVESGRAEKAWMLFGGNVMTEWVFNRETGKIEVNP